MKKLFSIVFLLLLTSSIFSQNRTIRVGMTIKKNAETGRCYGYEYEYLQEIAKFTGWNYEFIPNSKIGYCNALKNNYVDFILNYPDMPKDESFIEGTYPIIKLTVYIFKRINDKTISSDDISTLNGCKIGVVRNSTVISYLKDFEEKENLNFTYVYFNSFSELKRVFDSDPDYLDAVCMTDYFAQGMTNIYAVTELPSYTLNLLFNEKNKEIADTFNRAQRLLHDKNPNFSRDLKIKYFEFYNPQNIKTEVEEEWISKNNSITIGYVKNSWPFCVEDSKGNVSGLLPRFMTEILNRLDLEDFTVNYVPYDNYEMSIVALQNKQINAIFPMYGDFYEAENHNLHKSDDLLKLDMGLLYKQTEDISQINEILVRDNLKFLSNYVDDHLQKYEKTPVVFDLSKSNINEILKYDNSAILLSQPTIDILKSIPKYRTLNFYQLPDKCPVAFGVRRDDVVFLSLLDRGIKLLDSNFESIALNDYISSNEKYHFSDFLRDNLFATLTVFVLIFALIVLILLIYINSMQRNKKKLEASRIELDKALKIAENASRSKSNFLNNMSHDIRTPMNAIIGFTNLAQKFADDEKKVRDYLSKIQVSSMHLLNLINDVLDMSRIESGKVVLEEKAENLFEIIDEMKTILQSDIERKNFTFNVDTSLIKNSGIICDKLRLNQILLNLLSNAIKYTPENGQIDFIVSENPEANGEKHEYSIVVRDNGIGMSKEFQDSIFESFERENSSTISKIQGTGLGMAITKKLIEMMGGSIRVKSEKNFGSEFTVILDFKIVENNGTELKKEDNKDSNDKVSNIFKGKRVLLVEDNDLNQEIAIAILEDLGFVVELAENGAVAVVKTRESANNTFNHYDIILMDIQMPVLNGYDATREIRAIENDYCRNIPIVAMTANAFEEDKKEAFATGMNDHISKPINVKELIRILSGFFIGK